MFNSQFPILIRVEGESWAKHNGIAVGAVNSFSAEGYWYCPPESGGHSAGFDTSQCLKLTSVIWKALVYDRVFNYSVESSIYENTPSTRMRIGN